MPYREHLIPEAAPTIFSDYDIILDCTDHPKSRYLISDTAVALQKPLVSASALRTEGQLIVLNNPPRPPGDTTGGPCYRCVFPKPPPAESVTSCADGGILGPVVGTMGVLQALEAIKLITAGPDDATMEPTSLMLFSAYSNPQFRSMRLRRRRKDCVSCSESATITAEGLRSGSMDYVQLCGVLNPVKVLEEHERVSPEAYHHSMTEKHVLVDVREKIQFDICHLPGSINIPWSDIQSGAVGSLSLKASVDTQKPRELGALGTDDPVYVVCRLGNDSQIAVRKFQEMDKTTGNERSFKDIKGGLRAWKQKVDPEWPDY